MSEEINPKDKTKPHTILKPIVYSGPNRDFHTEPARSAQSGLIRSRLGPNDGIQPTFEHLSDAAYTLLRLKRSLVPVTPSKGASK